MAKAVKRKARTQARKTVKKTVKKEPVPASILKKVAAVSDSNRTLQKEIRVMSRIFGENQKVLVSLKDMVDTLMTTLEHIQRQSKRINIIEDDAQKLYAGLNQVRAQSNMVSRINDQTTKLEKEFGKISALQKSSKSSELSAQVRESANSIKNNSHMIIKIAQRIDQIRDDLKKVSGKTDSFLEIGAEMNSLRDTVDGISAKRSDAGSQIGALREELGRIAKGVSSTANLGPELDAIKATIDAVSSRASKIDSLEGVIQGLREQFDTVSSKAGMMDGLSMESVRELGGKIDRIETEIGSLSQRADSTAFVGEGLKSVQEEFSDFKRNVFEKTDSIEQKISTVSDTLRRQDESAAQLHEKSERLYGELQSVKKVTSKASDDSSKEMMALLKLSEYQSSIRMNTESKYGTAKDIEEMAKQTANIVNLFDRVSVESGERLPLPGQVRQWAIGKIFDCADRWEIRFGDVYSVLVNSIGRDMLKESVRIQQVRDIYGIRAVDEIRGDLNIS